MKLKDFEVLNKNLSNLICFRQCSVPWDIMCSDVATVEVLKTECDQTHLTKTFAMKERMEMKY